jgi:monoamine oxidase
MNHDVIVLGAGLAGLSCARDLVRGGADVLVVEARQRVGGRVEQTALPDGRLVQLGGEVVGPFHTGYAGLVAELGLTLVPSFPQLPGEETWVLAGGQTVIGDGYPWLTDADRASYQKAEAEFAALTATVDPDDPWSHPDAVALDRLSVGDWLRSIGATPNVVRARDLFMLALGAGSGTRWRPRWSSPIRTRSGSGRGRTATSSSRPRCSAAPGCSTRASSRRWCRRSGWPRS